MLLLIVGIACVVSALAVGGYVALAGEGRERTAPVPSPLLVEAPIVGGRGRSALQQRLAAVGARASRPGYTARVQHSLDLAGNPPGWSVERLLAMRGAGLIVGVLLGVLFGAKHGALVLVLAASLLGGFGLVVPGLLLRNRGEHRQFELRKGLPDALDMLTVCVEAGMGFDAAVGRVARNLTGPMVQEFARLQQEMQVGKSRAEALRALAGRTTVPEIGAFVSAVVQSGEMGISIGDVLRDQAKQLRVKRRQRAEEAAQKLQVKLLMPLVLCLLPVMFIVVLGPAVLNLAHFFHGVN